VNDAEAWDELRDIARRWQGQLLRRDRSNLGFQADPRVILSSLALTAQDSSFERSDHCSLCLQAQAVDDVARELLALCLRQDAVDPDAGKRTP
jgi:hypothetical protein